MYQQHMQSEESLENNAQGANRKPVAHKLAWWIGGVILLSAGSAVGGECPNTVTGIFDGDHKAVYSDCARNHGTYNHNIMLADGGIIASPEPSTKLVPAPGSLPNPITIDDSGIYGPSTSDACDLVPAGALNGSYYATMSSFKYYCAVWRDSGGREQRISAFWDGRGFFDKVSMTDTAIVDVTPEMSLTKSAQPTTYVLPGDQVVYTFLVTNTGNVALSTITVSDGLSGLGAIICNTSGNATIASLAVGASETCMATYVTTPAAFVAGSVSNTASVSALTPAVSADSNEVTINKLNNVCYEGALIIPDGTVFRGAGTTIYSSTVSIETESPAISGIIVETPHVLELHAPIVKFNSLFEVEYLMDSGQLNVITGVVNCDG